MDTTQQTLALIEALAADKSISQPWRNYAVSDARRVLALIGMGKTTTNLAPPPELANRPAQADQCTCKPLEINSDCPIHGKK